MVDQNNNTAINLATQSAVPANATTSASLAEAAKKNKAPATGDKAKKKDEDKPIDISKGKNKLKKET